MCTFSLPLSGSFFLLLSGNKGKRSTNRDEFGDEDDAMSTGTTDTYGSAFDYPENNNGAGGGGGGGAASDGRGGEAAGGEDGSSSKVVDDFKDGVEMLTEKR